MHQRTAQRFIELAVSLSLSACVCLALSRKFQRKIDYSMQRTKSLDNAASPPWVKAFLWVLLTAAIEHCRARFSRTEESWTAGPSLLWSSVHQTDTYLQCLNTIPRGSEVALGPLIAAACVATLRQLAHSSLPVAVRSTPPQLPENRFFTSCVARFSHRGEQHSV